jgi:hypothetical protein
VQSRPEALLDLLGPDPVLAVPLRAAFSLDAENVARDSVGTLELHSELTLLMPRPRASYRRGGIYVVARRISVACPARVPRDCSQSDKLGRWPGSMSSSSHRPKGGCMDEVSARAEMADAVDDSRLAVTVPRDEVERILAIEEDVDLVLDVVRTNGEREERRIFLAWDREALRHLVDQSGERIVVAIDPNSLQEALDADVEAHGMREMGATLAIAVTALAGAGGAGAALDPGGYHQFSAQLPAVEATVDTSHYPVNVAGQAVQEDAQATVVVDTSDYPVSVAGQTSEAGMPRAMPSDYAAAGVETDAILSGAPGAPGADIESVRAAQSVEPTASADIETVRAGGSAIPDPDSAIENVRATRTAPEAGDSGGITIDAPSAGVTAALAGGAALTIAAAAFALRRRREPEPAT